MARRKGAITISLNVDQDFKDKYRERWQSQGYLYEAEYTRKLIRDDMRKGREGVE